MYPRHLDIWSQPESTLGYKMRGLDHYSHALGSFCRIFGLAAKEATDFVMVLQL